MTRGFTLQREQLVQEINAHAKIYEHEKTGAQVLSIAAEDTNKVFGITFRTPPTDSTGIAHILEHSVLCGSKKFPVKEPFVELLKSSLQTFLNAMTYPDKTVYPVASENLKDFYNLMDVYLDAVFFPRIGEEIFQQEGWHYELNDPGEPLTYKGVVYNEMKGAYSAPEDVLSEISQQSLFPDSTYGLDSGGDPRHIPDLTYAQFKSFHETLYHPSNAYIYFYGDDEEDERLQRLAVYLDQFERHEIDSHIKPQPPLTEARRLTRAFDPGEEGEENARAMFTINWLLPRITDADANLSLGILAYSLIGTSAAPLRKALIDSGLGEDLSGSGFASYILQIYFGTGLRGVRSDAIPEAEALIWDTLRDLARDGIDPDILEAAFNTTEFRMRESNTGGYPRGLAYMLSALNFWLYGADPLEPLQFEAPLARVRAAYSKNPNLFASLIDTHFLKNPHYTMVTMIPEADFGRRETEEEAQRLADHRQAMSADDVAAVLENTSTLRDLQEALDSPEALATIPTLARSDVDSDNKKIPIEHDRAGTAPLLYHELFTNGVVYLDVGFDLRMLPERLLPYVPLFGEAMLEMGTEKEDFVTLSNRIGKHTGGIGPSTISGSVRNSNAAATWLILRGKSTVAKIDELLGILGDICSMPTLNDRERFKQIVLEEKADFEAGILPGGSSVADTRLRGGYRLADWVSEQMRGISHLFALRDLEKRIETDWDSVAEDLRVMHRCLITRHAMMLNVTVSGEDWGAVRSRLESFVGGLPDGEAQIQVWSPALSPRSEGLTIPAKVNYVTKGANLYKHGYALHGSVAAVTNFLRVGYLWDKVRVQGGAYGAFCSFDIRSGIFSFGSYRDPNLLETLSAYDGAGAFLRSLDIDDDEMTKNILGAIGRLDSYRLPDAQGYTSLVQHLVGETEESLQTYREQLLSATPAHLRNFAEALDAVEREGTVVVVGARESLESVDRILGDPPLLTPVL
jgi:Zn-dependent M16 (insulinase) family peptidase